MITAGASAQHREVFEPGYDYERLERVVTELLTEHRKLRSENEELRRELIERDELMAGLDQRVTQQEQRRTDALKSVDDLIAQVEGFATLASHAAGN
jgi:regulator of replication initiation timing